MMAPSNSIPVGEGEDTGGKETNHQLNLALRIFLVAKKTKSYHSQCLFPQPQGESSLICCFCREKERASLPFELIALSSLACMSQWLPEVWRDDPLQNHKGRSAQLQRGGPTLKRGLPAATFSSRKCLGSPSISSSEGQAGLGLCSLHGWPSRKDHMSAHHVADPNPS